MAKSVTTGKTVKKTAAKKAVGKQKASSSKSAYDEKPWLESYPPDTPANIAPLAHNSVAELLEDSCRKFSGRPVFSCMGKTISYAELAEQSSVIGAWLQAHGLKKGDRVAIMMPNILQYPAVMMGILRAGCTVVNVNP
ncbi:MAG: AMP-binding protein, partial [Nitratireductor sp.]|nr:AMP-binding protein [Nitratireductor sp.]